MAVLLRCQDFVQLCAAAEALGGEAPASITAVLESVKAFRAAAASDRRGQHGGSSLEAAAAAGQAMTSEEIYEAYYAGAIADLVRKRIAEGIESFDHQAVELMQQMLRGDAGEELIGSLQPVVGEAIAGIQRGVEHFGPDTTLGQAIERAEGEAARSEVTEAWYATKRHVATLEQMLAEIVRPMTFGFDVLPPDVVAHHHTPGQPRLLAAWVISLDRATRIDAVGAELLKPIYSPGTPFMAPDATAPGRRWLTIHSLAGLRLNTPREAAAILQHLYDQQKAEDEERYKPRKAQEAAEKKVREGQAERARLNEAHRTRARTRVGG